MPTKSVCVLSCCLALSVSSIAQADVIAGSVPLPRFPSVSTTAITFVAQGNLWTMPRAGGRATPLTNDPGQVLAPHFSPDGRSIAFTWCRSGSNDVYVLPAGGGTPVRLTHGPSLTAYDNLVTGWTPDGSRVLFLSLRASPLKGSETYEVSATGGLATPINLGHSGLSSLSPDGTRIVYDWSYRNLGGDRWKRYRGGQAGELFIFDFAHRRLARLTDWEGIDTAPMWAGSRIYFLSDRGTERRLNIWMIDPVTKVARQITHYTDYDIDMPSIGPGGIAYQQGGKLRLIDLPSERVEDVSMSLPETVQDRPREVPGMPFAQHQDIVHHPDYALGPDGGTAYLAVRGDLFAVARDGRWADLTNTPDHVEDHPVVSPDGRTLAFITDIDGEQQVATMPLDQPGRTRVLTQFRAGVLYAPRWSPDGRWLAVADANKRLWLVDATSGKTEQIALDAYAEIQDATFSADSRSLAYSMVRTNQTRAIHLRDLAGGTDTVLSALLESDHDPAFAADGRSLFFVSARREHPFVSDRDRDGTVATLGSDGLYRATIPAEMAGDVRIFTKSAREVPVELPGGVADLQVRGDTLFYRATPLAGVDGDLRGQRSALHAWNASARRDRLVADDADGYVLSPDGGSALIVRDGGFHVVETTEDRHGDNALSLATLRVAIDLRAEHREMFEQAWRLDRDLFWDPKLDGMDWQAVHDRYAPLVEQARSHEDMIYLLGELQGELSTSHMFIAKGDSGDPRPAAATALIGADFTLDAAAGRYRLAHIYRGDESRSRFRAPLGNPTLDVRDGDYLLALDDEQLEAPDDPFRLLADRHGPLTLTVAHELNGPVRTITVDPIASEVEIRKLDWIARNRARVDRLSGGRVGYVFLSDFSELGSEDFLRQYYPQADKAGLVIDDRDNRGGFTSQWVLDLLHRPQAGIFRNREGGISTLPGALAPPHLVTVTNLFSASDGDQFPYFFRAWNLGAVVGQRTWGGVRGIKGPWQLIDGTTVTVPKDSLLTTAGAKIIENRGAEPDIVVNDSPADRIAGRDPQLEKAVALILAAKSN